MVCEVSAISIKLSKKANLNVLGLYCPRNKEKVTYLIMLHTLSSLLDQWMSQHNIIFIIGDFNVYSLITSREGILNELLAVFHMKRMNLAPTRVTQTTSSSIDMCCISANYIEDVEEQAFHTGISNHTGQLGKFNLEVRKKSPTATARRQINNNGLNI